MVQKPSLYVLAVHHRHDGIVAMMTANDTTGIDWEDKYGNTALHILCQERILHDKAITAIIEKKPLLTGKSNCHGSTPLHLALERRLSLQSDCPDSDVLIRMIRAYPRSLSLAMASSVSRATPFEIACSANRSVNVLKQMLLLEPLLGIPLPTTTSFVKTRLDHLWKCGSQQAMNLIVLTAFHGEMTVSTCFLLHAACCQNVPIQYLKKILKQYTCQASKVDHHGNLPIHYLCMDVQLRDQHYTKCILTLLLEVYPAAATVVNSDGRLPLHCLLEAQHTWHFGGIKELVYAHPNALQTLNIKMNLFPVQMAARNANRSLGHLSTLLEVLLSAPEMVNICK